MLWAHRALALHLVTGAKRDQHCTPSGGAYHLRQEGLCNFLGLVRGGIGARTS